MSNLATGKRTELALLMSPVALIALIRYTHIGEGSYAPTEQQIQTLLAEPWPCCLLSRQRGENL